MKNLTMRELLMDLQPVRGAGGDIQGFKFAESKIDEEMQKIVDYMSSQIGYKIEYSYIQRNTGNHYSDNAKIDSNSYILKGVLTHVLEGEEVKVSKTKNSGDYKLVNDDIRKSMFYHILRRPSVYEYGLFYVVSEMMNYYEDLGLTEDDVVKYVKVVLCKGALMNKRYSYRYYKLDNDIPSLHEFIHYSLGVIKDVKTKNGQLKVKVLNYLLYDLIETDFKLFRKVYKDASTMYVGYYVCDEMINDEFVDNLLSSISKSFKKNKAKADLIDLLYQVYSCADNNEEIQDKIIKFYLDNLNDKETVAALKRNPKLSDNEEFMKEIRRIREDKSEVDNNRGSADYFKNLSATLESVKKSTSKITLLDQFQFINKQNLSELQLVLIEKIFDVGQHYSETILKGSGYGKLVSAEPRIINNLISLVNTMSDTQFKESIKFIDMIVANYVASKSFFDSVPNSLMCVCNDTRLAEALLFSIENRPVSVVRNNFMNAYTTHKNAEPFKWAMKEFMKLDEMMLLDKKNYPKLCKAYLKFAI